MSKKIFLFIIILFFLCCTAYAEDNNMLKITTDNNTINSNNIFSVKIKFENIKDVYGLKLNIKYDNTYLVPIDTEIDLSSISDKKLFIATNEAKYTPNSSYLMLTLLGDENTFTPNCIIGKIKFKALKTGNTSIQIKESKLLKKDASIINHQTENMDIIINDCDNDSKSNYSLQEQRGIIYNQCPFVDIEDNWARKYILHLLSKNIINGVDSTHFQPNRYITRAESAKILNLSLDSNNNHKNKDMKNFTDKASIPSWARLHIQNLCSLNIYSGYKDNTFRPNKYITRGELAKVIWECMDKSKTPHNTKTFKDNEAIPAWCKESIYGLEFLGIIDGYKDNTFRANSPITRAEVCKIIVEFMKY